MMKVKISDSMILGGEYGVFFSCATLFFLFYNAFV
jgi:hypothetical protein